MLRGIIETGELLGLKDNVVPGMRPAPGIGFSGLYNETNSDFTDKGFPSGFSPYQRSEQGKRFTFSQVHLFL